MGIAPNRKIDIADAVGYDRAAANRSMREVNQALIVLEVSARTGTGMDRWTELIEERLAQKAGEPALS